MIKEIKNHDEEGIDIVINTLNEAIELAKDGDIVAVCVTYIRRNGDVGTKHGGYYAEAMLVGALEYSKKGILDLVNP